MEMLQIWHKHSLRLSDEQFGGQMSKVKVIVTY